jgi:hypothetical protein
MLCGQTAGYRHTLFPSLRKYYSTLLTDSYHVMSTSLSPHLRWRKHPECHVNTADFHVPTDFKSTAYLPEPRLNITAAQPLSVIYLFIIIIIWNTKWVQHARETSFIRDQCKCNRVRKCCGLDNINVPPSIQDIQYWHTSDDVCEPMSNAVLTRHNTSA